MTRDPGLHNSKEEDATNSRKSSKRSWLEGSDGFGSEYVAVRVTGKISKWTDHRGNWKFRF